ncbi:tetratricopeptide repeat protein [Jiulongibacter sediminis]|uniref:Uncharacterized protein n=1 Tax=Jiulongibacter sediminis TaxID=1605367 RepID=A0A0P7C2N7_9BACT|nr:tetratricopeptide repeat protein [Jiulongibacter sediminis]KPM48368.1 hypothetical protein AFM12_06900 [Jiulongibacter sediminis]TBX24905.1 hypothetical protein TK44_06905 [Jiulongibacter sediminis]
MLITSLSAFSQGIEESFLFANSLYENQQYQNAVETYKRVLFFDSDDIYGPQSYKKMADCLYETGEFAEASYYYDLAYFTHSGTEQADITLQKISCHLLLREYNLAQVELFNLPDSLKENQTEQKVFYEAMLAFATEDFEMAEELFKDIAPDTLAVHELFRENDKINKLSPKKAKILSIILPGLGQFYAGDVKNGLNSLLLTGGLLYLGAASAVKTSILDASISVLPWFQRYYSGGYNKAEAIAEAKIKERRFKVFNELLDEVEN